MQRKIALTKDAYLWEAGDAARNLAVLEKGRLGVRSGEKLIGIITPRMVLGESALLGLDGSAQQRTAAVAALEDDTMVSEYPASMFRQTFDAGNHGVGHLILMTLIGQACRNYLLIVAAHKERAAVTTLLTGEVRALGETAVEVRHIRSWDDFLWTFRYLYDLRDHSDAMRAQLVMHLAADSAALKRASEMMRDLVKGQDVATYLEEFIAAEREKEEWFQGQTR